MNQHITSFIREHTPELIRESGVGDKGEGEVAGGQGGEGMSRDGGGGGEAEKKASMFGEAEGADALLW
jgi:hypothetical protein